MKIAFVFVATNKYMEFIPPLLNSVYEYFLPEVEKHCFVFTEQTDYALDHGAEKIQITPKGWPGDSYYRYHYFLSIKDRLQNYDYIYYLDADMRVVDYVGEEVLTDLLGIQHPGYVVNKQGSPEDRLTNSTAYITRDKIKQYCCGGFQGGSSTEYLKLCETVSKNIDKDDENGLLAIYHDESHVNKYFVGNPPTRILNAGYCAPESAWKVPFPFKILALDKSVDIILGKADR